MLSRIAESLYWIGRYVERVDGTARIVDVLRLQLVEAGGSGEDSVASVALSVILGLRLQADSSFADVSRRMVFELDQPGSISASWRDARENARRARETLSLEHWEAINTSWRHWCQLPQREVTSRHLGFARERTALIRGTADSTMSHDEAWEFLVLGRSLERADMTARIVATGALPQLGLTGRPSCRRWGPSRRTCAPTAAWSPRRARRRHSSSWTGPSRDRSSMRSPKSSGPSCGSTRPTAGWASPTRPDVAWVRSAPPWSTGPSKRSSPMSRPRCAVCSGP